VVVLVPKVMLDPVALTVAVGVTEGDTDKDLSSIATLPAAILPTCVAVPA